MRTLLVNEFRPHLMIKQNVVTRRPQNRIFRSCANKKNGWLKLNAISHGWANQSTRLGRTRRLGRTPTLPFRTARRFTPVTQPSGHRQRHRPARRRGHEQARLRMWHANSRTRFAFIPGRKGQACSDGPGRLAHGVDIEARPPGKRVKRLSLLSGRRTVSDCGGISRSDFQGASLAVLRDG